MISSGKKKNGSTYIYATVHTYVNVYTYIVHCIPLSILVTQKIQSGKLNKCISTFTYVKSMYNLPQHSGGKTIEDEVRGGV